MKYLISILTGLTLVLSAAPSLAAKKAEPKLLKDELVKTTLEKYNDLVLKNYESTLKEAKNLRETLVTLTKTPSQDNLEKARSAWKAARIPYSKTEAYRFWGGPIDAAETGPEPVLNSWPVDESYIDYVEGNLESGIINRTQQYPKITKEVLTLANTKDGEANISTGYHAIEFLLWGQDLNPKGPGARPFTDYVKGKGKNAERRAQYLLVVTDQLIGDLEFVTAQWRDKKYLPVLVKTNKQEMIQKIMTGLSSLAYDEMAGERMTVAIEIKSQENEQDCFSDFTLEDMKANLEGIREVWEDTGLRELIAVDAKGVKKASVQLAKAKTHLENLNGTTFDQVIAAGKKSKDGKTVDALINDLHLFAKEIANAGKVYGLELNVQ